VSLRARKPCLAVAHVEGLMTAQPSFERCALFVCNLVHIERWFHRAEESIPYPACTKTLLKLP
jgi:hypothetical protein